MAQIPLQSIDDLARGLNSIPPPSSITQPRAATLYIEETAPGSGLQLRVVPHPDYASQFPQKLSATLPVNGLRFQGVVQKYTGVWTDEVVKYRPFGYGYLFQERASRPLDALPPPFNSRVFDQRLARIAAAGFSLFQQILNPAEDGWDDLCAIASSLEQLARVPDLRIKIVAGDFSAPWNLMYLRSDFEKPVPEGFWGYQHIIEHECRETLTELRPLEPALAVALHFDEAIDQDFPRFQPNSQVNQFLRGYSLTFRPAHTKEAFINGLKAGAAEGVFYFCCHARADDPRLELNDTRTPQQIAANDKRECIEPDELDRYLIGDRKYLAGSPIIFLNACESAQMNAGFYQGFARKFLGHRACAVLGPHIELPIVFGRDFAHRFFEELFKGGSENNIGAVLLRLRRDFLSKDANPLGLVYSLYRGADVYVRTPVLKA